MKKMKLETWNKIKSKAAITFEDYDEIINYLSQVFEENKELRKSRDKWSKRYKELKNKK